MWKTNLRRRICKHCFRYLIPLWLVNCDSYFSFGISRAESNKHVEHMKPSYTALFDVLTFDVLTRETIFHQVGGSGRIAVFEKMLTASSLLHLFPPFFARSPFLCPFAFLASLHWPRAWPNRIKKSDLNSRIIGIFMRCYFLSFLAL